MGNLATQQTNGNVITAQNTEKLSFGTKLSYGLGEFSGNVVWSLVASYLLSLTAL